MLMAFTLMSHSRGEYNKNSSCIHSSGDRESRSPGSRVFESGANGSRLIGRASDRGNGRQLPEPNSLERRHRPHEGVCDIKPYHIFPAMAKERGLIKKALNRIAKRPMITLTYKYRGVTVSDTAFIENLNKILWRRSKLLQGYFGNGYC